MPKNARFLFRWYISWIAYFALAGAIQAWSLGFGILVVLILMPVGVLAMLAAATLFTWQFVTQRGNVADSLATHQILLLGPGALVLALMASWQAFSFGGHVATLSKLALHHSEYQAIMAGYNPNSAPAPAAVQTRFGITYQVDAGPPVRFAFDGNGLLNDWNGIVFDPTETVAEARGWGSHHHRARELKQLFGSNLGSCSHLWGAYYACSFS